MGASLKLAVVGVREIYPATKLHPMDPGLSLFAEAHRDLFSLSPKTRILQLRSRQIDHHTTVCKVGDPKTFRTCVSRGVYLIGVCLTGVHLMGVHLTAYI
jgi:hypothetical protein